MRTTVLAIVLGFLPALFAADPGDPSPLAVPPDKTARAVELARQLDDDDIRIRDRASEELAQLGRFALPAIRQTLTGKRSVEVKNRIERLMPGALAADFAVRYPVFLADVGRKFDHDFLGWSELKAITMDTEASRTLFADMLADENTRSLLLAMVRSQPEAQELFQ